MEKTAVFWIIICVGAALLAATFFYNFFYFEKFHEKARQVTDAEKEKVTEILNASMDIEGAEIKFGNVFPIKDKNLIQVDVTMDGSKKHYLVDIAEGRIVRK